MAYDNHLASRIQRILEQKKVSFEAKKMMGGLCFMVDDKMCCGVVNNQLMARIHPDDYQKALQAPGCSRMEFTGRPMKGFVFVGDEGIDLGKDLEYWVQQCLNFNPLAKSSKKKKP